MEINDGPPEGDILFHAAPGPTSKDRKLHVCFYITGCACLLTRPAARRASVAFLGRRRKNVALCPPSLMSILSPTSAHADVPQVDP
jgi:hypothetical protein